MHAQVLDELWKAQLNAEPTTATDGLVMYDRHKGWAGPVLVGAFGFMVVVLLLNLLIAVFAKTVRADATTRAVTWRHYPFTQPCTIPPPAHHQGSARLVT